jgi:hypothetical protein
VSSVASFALTPIPLFVLMGEVLFHTGLAVKVIEGIERLVRDIPGRLAVGRGRRGHRFLGHLGLDDRDDGDARQPDGAGDDRARLPPDDGHRPDHGDRRGRHADPALGARPVLLGSLSGISISKLLVGGVTPGLILSVIFVAYIVVRRDARPRACARRAHRGRSRLGEVPPVRAST